MRLRASFTVENSFIIPFFTMIIVVMVILALDMHDELIGKAVSFQGNMKIEQEKLEGSNRNLCVSDVSSYAGLKSMRKSMNDEEIKKIMDENKVVNNSPREFIRKTRAALKLIPQ